MERAVLNGTYFIIPATTKALSGVANLNVYVLELVPNSPNLSKPLSEDSCLSLWSL
jgi:hypothetical protein